MDDTDLVTFDNEKELAMEVVTRAQLVLDTQHQALTFTGGNLKLNKCFWTIQDFMQKNRKYNLQEETPFQITILQEEKRVLIKYLTLSESRTLVGVLVTLAHYLKNVVKLQLAEYKTRLATS